jgi:hypothetical protein
MGNSENETAFGIQAVAWLTQPRRVVSIGTDAWMPNAAMNGAV